MWWLNEPKKKLSIPDWLSVYRMLSSPFLIVLMVADQRILFGVFISISLLTDILDGYFARKMNIVTQRGAQLDSIGDVITFLVGLAGIVVFETAFVKEQIWLISFAFGIYLVQLVMAYRRYGKPSSFHTYLAKIAAVFQGSFMIWVFFFDVELWLFYAAVGLTIVEVAEEIILVFIFSEWKTDVKGLFWVMKKKEEK